MTDKPDFRRLRLIQIVAVVVGAVVLLGVALADGAVPETGSRADRHGGCLRQYQLQWAFYFGALLLEGSLQKYILSDDTVIKGDNVEMVTTTAESGDPEIDKWIGTYAFTRNLFGMSLVPILILIGLYFFA
jgi:hypothetical protein